MRTAVEREDQIEDGERSLAAAQRDLADLRYSARSEEMARQDLQVGQWAGGRAGGWVGAAWGVTGPAGGSVGGVLRCGVLSAAWWWVDGVVVCETGRGMHAGGPLAPLRPPPRR